MNSHVLARPTRSFAFLVLAALLAGTAFAHYTFQKSPDHVYICTFNVFRLGDIEPKYDRLEENDDEGDDAIPERIRNLARVLVTGDFDLIVLQEVTHGDKGQWVLSDLVQELNTVHHRHYRFFLSDHIGQGLMPEAMAFIYNPDRVKPLPLAGTALCANIEISGRDLVRTKWVSGSFDFTLISAHLAWGNKADREEGDRKILEILTTPAPSAYSDDPDIIVLGDVNRFGIDFTFFDTLPAYQPGLFLAPNITFFDPGFKTIREVKKAHIAGRGIPQDDPQLLSTTVAKNTFVYDVFLLSPDVDEELPGTGNAAVLGTDWGIIHYDEPNGFGYQSGAELLGQNALKVAYSDHRPLWMRFRTNLNHADSQSPAPAATTYVATATGRKFHRPDCPSIANSTVAVTWTSRTDALASRGPCGVCKP